jgi:hypothetical protein
MCARILFATSATTTGNILPDGGKTRGVAGGDALCMSLRRQEWGNVTFKSWLGTVDYQPAKNLDGDAGAGYVTPRGDFVAAEGGLVSLPLLRPPNVMEDGGSLEDGATAWTGANPDGTSAGFDCLGWTSESSGETGEYGVTAETGIRWTAYEVPGSCDVPRHIYCVEQ